MDNWNNDDEFKSVVTMKDIDRVSKMNKDVLKKWVNQPCTFNYVIDHIRSISQLRNQVIGMIKVRVGEEVAKKKKNGEDVDEIDADELVLGYLLNPANNRVFEATVALLKRDDFIPCDEKGKRI